MNKIQERIRQLEKDMRNANDKRRKKMQIQIKKLKSQLPKKKITKKIKDIFTSDEI